MLGKFKKVYGIILEIKIKIEIDKIALEQNRSSSNLINYILKKYLNEFENNKSDS